MKKKFVHLNKKGGKNKQAEKLRKSSRYVRQWLTHQPSVKEESITDWLLFDISKKIPGIYYKAFTRNEEARKTGADWEWWFVFREFAMKLRIQAKKLKHSSDNYPSLAYTNKHGLQIEKLLNDSVVENFLPLYAFYTSSATVTRCGQNILDEGVYLAGGKEVYHDFILKGELPVNESALLQKSNALSCLLGCPFNHEPRRKLVDFFKRYYSTDTLVDSETVDDERGHNEILGYHGEPPNYVNSFLEYSAKGIPDWWEREFQHYIKDVDSLVVYDGRNDES